MPGITNGNTVSSPAQFAAGVVDSSAILDGGIMNADVNAAAAIDQSKLANAAKSGANSDITSLSALSSPLSVPQGGLGAGTFTDGGVLIGNANGVVQATSAGTSGQVLTSNGAGNDPTYQTAPVDWIQVAQTILGSGSTTLTASSIPSRKHLMILVTIPTSSNLNDVDMIFNADSSANYSARRSVSGAADATNVSQTKISLGNGTLTLKAWSMTAFVNQIASVGKHVIATIVADAAVATAPGRIELTGFWGNTASNVTSITLTLGGANTFGVGSIITVFASKD